MGKSEDPWLTDHPAHHWSVKCLQARREVDWERQSNHIVFVPFGRKKLSAIIEKRKIISFKEADNFIS